MGSIPSGYGLISGFDTSSLIERMLAYQYHGRSSLESRIGILQARRSAMLDINAGLLALSTSTSALRSSSTFEALAASSSHPSILTAFAGAGAAAGIHQFIVASLATNHQLLSGGFASDAAALGLFGATIELGDGALINDMPLAWLNGGSGITRGVIELTRLDTGESVEVDLRDVATVDEVMARLSANGLGIDVTLDEGGIVLTTEAGFEFSVSTAGGASTAADLGIGGSSSGGVLSGQRLATLGGGLSLAALNDGNGVLVREGLADLRITTADGRIFDVDLSQGAIVDIDDDTLLSALNGGNGVFIDADATDADMSIHLTDGTSGATTTWDIDLTGCVTVGDVRDRVQQATGGAVTLELRSDGQGFEVQPMDAGDTVSIHGAGTQGETTASDLGILNVGGAVGGYIGSSVAAVGDGGVPTIQAVLDAINTAADLNGIGNDGAVVARVSSDGLRLELEDTTAGGGSLSVEGTAANSSAFAALGFDGADGSSGLMQGRRVIGGVGDVLIHELRGGAGLPNADNLTITDRFGTTASISGLSQHETVGDLINAINDWADDAGLRIDMGIDPNGTGLQLTDQGGSGSLIVSGTLAEALGLEVNAAVSSVSSGNLQHRWISEATALGDLNQGRGIGIGSFRIRDGNGATATVTITSAHATVQDVLDQINSRGLAIQASINSTGDGIVLTSTTSDPVVPIAVESISGSSAGDLNLLGEGDTSINGSWEIVIDVDGQTTLRDLVDRINESQSEVSAALINTGDPGTPWRISLTSTVSGEAGRVVISLDGVDANFEEVIAASDARIVLGDDLANGILITSQSNHVEGVIGGLTLDLLSASEEVVTITIAGDSDGALAAVRSFVEAINAVFERIDGVSSFDADTMVRGVLHGDATTTRVKRMLQSLIQNRDVPDGISLEGLWSIGIRIGAGGRVELDEAKFTEAWTERREDVEAMFMAEADADGVAGFGIRFDDLVSHFTNTNGGTLDLADDAMQGRLDLAFERLERIDARIESRRLRLFAEFTAMEEALAAIQSQSMSLLAFGSGPSSWF